MPFVSRRNAVFHVAAIVLCAWALWRGVRTTWHLDWPGNPDNLRDIGHAQTIQDGSLLDDPSYLGEQIWYNPLVPALVAGLSSALDVPVNVLHARGGAYLNLAAPIAFYVMGASMLGAPTALGALSAFFVMSPEPSWLTVTYSPWLFPANFVQAIFYTAVLVYLRAYRRRDWRWHLLTGVLLGLIFLGHTAPALLLGTIVFIGTVDRIVREPDGRRTALLQFLVVTVVAALVATPFLLSIVWHYGLSVKNPVPASWLDESLLLDRWREFLAANVRRPLLNAFILVAAVRLIVAPPRRRGTRLVIAAWIASAVTFLIWNAYAPQVSWTRSIPQIVPAHHFLVYVRAGEALLFGHGLWVFASMAAAMAVRLNGARISWVTGPRLAGAAIVSVVAILVVLYGPAQDRNIEFTVLRGVALRAYADADMRRVFTWLREHSAPSDVFLTIENSGLSIIGAAGRKAIAVPRFFSNPYVDYEMRNQARLYLWGFLEAQNCLDFLRVAHAYHLTHVLAIQGLTPVPSQGQCGLQLVFTSGNYSMWRLKR